MSGWVRECDRYSVFDAGLGIHRALTRFVVERAASYKWSIQGFGMLRLYLEGSREPRLNIWDSRYRVPHVSMIHTHPWNFASLIVSGKLTNVRYRRAHSGDSSASIVEMHASTIKPGPGGGLRRHAGEYLEGEDFHRLVEMPAERYLPGDIYFQEANEIHVSLPEDGCITINLRDRVGEDVATTFWPRGTEWVSAVPREATPEEVEDIAQFALKGLK